MTEISGETVLGGIASVILCEDMCRLVRALHHYLGVEYIQHSSKVLSGDHFPTI